MQYYILTISASKNKAKRQNVMLHFYVLPSKKVDDGGRGVLALFLFCLFLQKRSFRDVKM